MDEQTDGLFSIKYPIIIPELKIAQCLKCKQVIY